MTTTVPDSLAKTDRPDCQSACPDSSGQEQGGVGRSVHTRAIARVVAGPEGPREQAPCLYVIVNERTYSEQIWQISGRSFSCCRRDPTGRFAPFPGCTAPSPLPLPRPAGERGKGGAVG